VIGFTPGSFTSDAHPIYGWVGNRTALDDMQKRKFSPSPGVNFNILAVQPVASQRK
jgi:hypothetical protein